MPALHFFNPGHETAVLLGSSNYTPPTNVKQMTEDLALLPLWYAESSDLIYIGDKHEKAFFESLPKGLPSFASPLSTETKAGETSYRATPWGISPQSLSLLAKASKQYSINVTLPKWEKIHRDLTGRQSTFLCHKLLSNRALFPDIPQVPETACSMESFEQLLQETELPAVVKTPYSSSGRGILWLHSKVLAHAEKNRIKGSIKKQGFVSIEKGLNKKTDFALEFYSNGKGEVRYEGISVFITEERGSYIGNKLAAQTRLQKELESSCSVLNIEEISQAVSEVLGRVYGMHYEGYLGVDMMLYETKGRIAVHPCVEVNMRRTMGVVALQLFERYIEPSAQGLFYVSFDKEKGSALNKHLDLLNKHPLQLKNGKISSGYLSLCPVSEQTGYRAYIII